MLLLGGQGTLAAWTRTGAVPGARLASGSLSLGAPSCTWQLTQTGGTVSQVPSPNPTTYTGQLLQPDDVVTGTCTAAVQVTADHFKGHIAVALASPPAPLQEVGTPTISTSDGANDQVTRATTSVTVTVKLTIPSSDTSNPTADANNAWNANLISITAVQDPPS